MKTLFDKINMPILLGYTLWRKKSNGSLHPLDSRYTIPEQTDYLNELWFQRRFYILSKEVLQTLQTAIHTLNECKTYLFNNDVVITPSDAVQLAVYSLYALSNDNVLERGSIS